MDVGELSYCTAGRDCLLVLWPMVGWDNQQKSAQAALTNIRHGPNIQN